MPSETFRDLFEAHRGKASDKWDLYLKVYEEIFAPLRDKPMTLLEIGVQNGGSLDILADYFRNAKAIVGVDINPQCASLPFESERISVIIGDAKSGKTREGISSRAALFDVIIDDGSHVSNDIIATFFHLVPLLGDNGIYVVEDMHASYWKEYGGELFAPYSAAAFFKTLTDVLNHEHWSLNKPPADLLQPFANRVQAALPMDHLERIESITFLNSICIMRKTAGERTTLGARRITGRESNIAKIERFEAFSRKAELHSAEDYFRAWQPQPPLEALAAKARLVADLKQQMADHIEQVVGPTRERPATHQRTREQNNGWMQVRKQKRSLAEQLNHAQQQIGEQSRMLIEFRQEADQLRHHLMQMHQSSSWRLTYPLRLAKRVIRFSWHLQHAFFSNGSFLVSFGFRLLSQMLTEPDLAEATMHRVHTDADLRSEIMQTMGMTPAEYAALSALARHMEKGYRALRTTGRRLLLSRLLSGATRAYQGVRQRGVRFHLDEPQGIFVPTRRGVMFRGWAVDTNTKEAAEVRVFAGGQPVRVDRYKRGDVTAAFPDQVSKNAKAAFEAKVALRGRSTWVRVELASAPDRWVLVHRALLRLVGSIEATDLRSKRTGDSAEWFDILQNHLAAQIDEMREHIDTMILRPAFLVIIDARKSGHNLDVTIGSLRAQIYRAAGVVVLGRDRPDDDNNRIQLAPTVSDETVQWIDRLDVCAPLFANLDYLLFIEPGDRIVPSALYSFASAINRDPTSELIYSDELFPTSSGAPLPFHKPAWSPDYLECFDYIGHSGVFSMARARRLSLPFTSVYDFTLRFTDSLGHDLVAHLDDLLFERAAPFARKMTGDDDVAAILGRLERTGRNGIVAPAPSGINCYHARVRWERAPEISVVIPTAGYTKLIAGRDIDLIVNITQQIVERSTYRTAEIVVVDNGDLNECQKNHLAKLGCRSVTFEEQAFNIAKKLNLGASVAKGELLLLMNDDMEIVQEDWIERLCDHMAKPDVGVVGCKLLYPDRSTQHVGVIHYHGNPDHVRRGYPADDAGYFNSTCGVRNYLAVTGACMLTRRALYQQLGGYALQLAVSYNDADFCLNVRAAGYRVVYTGDVALVHMESLSRVPSANLDEVRYYHERWTPKLPEDPFYNERFLTLAPPSFEPRTNDRLL